jgi:hypothetical protein
MEYPLRKDLVSEEVGEVLGTKMTTATKQATTWDWTGLWSSSSCLEVVYASESPVSCVAVEGLRG